MQVLGDGGEGPQLGEGGLARAAVGGEDMFRTHERLTWKKTRTGGCGD
ncbi:putative oxidative stress regulatory protein OxyR [Streptomyces sp. Tu6071]|nr:putative oxidative stress regulatory protein OxyR [Streptomyces sp. Tu6071]